MNRGARSLFILAPPLAATFLVFACSDDARTTIPETTPDASPANLPEAGGPELDSAVVDARTQIDASDEPVVCNAKPCVTQLVGGGSHFCALLDDKTVRCWGSTFRALGIVDGGNLSGGVQPRPTTMGVSGVEQLSAAASTTCARLTDGSVTCWGANMANELGLDPPSSDYGPHDPAPVSIDGGVLRGFTRIDVGVSGAVFALKPGGELWSWGDNAESVLARRNDGTSYLGPGKAVDLGGENIRRAGGLSFREQFGIGFAVDDRGRLLTWGTSKLMVAYPGSVPMPVAGLENVGSVAVMSNNICVVADGRLFCWGANGRLACTGNPDAEAKPVEIRTRGKAPAQQVAILDNTCVRLTDGTIECCGSDSKGQLGTGTTTEPAPPSHLLTEAKAFTGHAVSVALGIATTCVLVQGGTVQCWGSNEAGLLGQGTHDSERHPTPVTVTFD